MRTVAWVRGIGKLTKPELVALAHAAERIPTTPTNLATCIGFETGGTFNPAQPNRAGSGAIGEIQFMPKVMCALLGLADTPENRRDASDRFARMTFTAQLEFVVKYFAWFKGRDLTALEDLYLAIFWPAAIGKPEDYVIGPRGSAVYRQNAGFDNAGNKDGIIQRWEVVSAIRNYRATANVMPDIEIPDNADPADIFKPEERAHFIELVARTSDEETEAFRAGTPLPEDAHLVEAA